MAITEKLQSGSDIHRDLILKSQEKLISKGEEAVWIWIMIPFAAKHLLVAGNSETRIHLCRRRWWQGWGSMSRSAKYIRVQHQTLFSIRSPCPGERTKRKSTSHIVQTDKTGSWCWLDWQYIVYYTISKIDARFMAPRYIPWFGALGNYWWMSCLEHECLRK